MKRDLRLIHPHAGGLRRAACLCILPLALVPLLPRAAQRHVAVSAAPPALAGSRPLGLGDCEQYRRAYRLCLAAGSAGAVPSPPQRGQADGRSISPRLLPGAESGLLPSCDELRAGARQRLASMNCKL